MTYRLPSALAALVLACAPVATATAQPPDAAQSPPTDTAPDTELDEPSDSDTAQRVSPLESDVSALTESVAQNADALRRMSAELARLRDENQLLREDLEFRDQQLQRAVGAIERVTGYIDIGFFHVAGDGSGIRADTGHAVFPEYDGVVPAGWVFMGDPLSTAINARGEPADTGVSRALAADPVDAGSAPSFIVNTVSLSVFRGLSEHLAVEATVDLMPRSRDHSDPNGVFLSQYFEIPRAYLEYLAPLHAFDLHLYAGKFDSTIGYEYRAREAPERIPVTPSLLCRYICGSPVGVKARALFFERALVLAASITNGSHFSERFPFRDEVDGNQFKTVAGRLSLSAPVGVGLEVGVSGAVGAQDGQMDERTHQWHLGVDASLEWRDIVLQGEFARGRAPGQSVAGEAPCGLTQCLDYRAAYGLVAYRARGGLIPYARVDWRNAVHEHGADFVYVSRLVRLSAGVRKEIGPYVIVKAEYTVNRELDPIPQFANDIFTSSLVARY